MEDTLKNYDYLSISCWQRIILAWLLQIHWVVEQDVPFVLGDGVKFHTVFQDLFDIAVVVAAVGLAWDNLVHS